MDNLLSHDAIGEELYSTW